MEAFRQSLIVKHHILINELEIKYMGLINDLLQQKALIHYQLQKQFYDCLSHIDNQMNKESKPYASTNYKPPQKHVHKREGIPPSIPFTILPIKQDNTHNITHTYINNNKLKPASTKLIADSSSIDSIRKNHKSIMRMIPLPKPNVIKKKFLCTICNKSMASKKSLTRHKRLHTGEKPFKCTLCNEAFIRNDYLKRHIRKTHNIDNDYVKRKSKQHIQIVTKENVNDYWKCDVCDIKFSRKYDLEQHKATHYSLKSFQCGYCKKKFRLKHFLRQHVKTVHYLNGVK